MGPESEVKLLKDSEKNISVDLMALLAVTRKIKDETEIYQCSVYAAALRDMGFQTREAAEFLSIFLPVTDEGAQPLICEDLVNLFTRSFEMTDSECQSLYSIFEQVLAEDKGVMVTSSAGPPREGLDFLGFMLLMHLGRSRAQGDRCGHRQQLAAEGIQLGFSFGEAGEVTEDG
ncbi:unnamed protein product [Durusdinium trenchii]|uniref:Uncharacterized protein n=1 Tax=Durusdinium trenchii TaxID=1381693 RepID=A0ABP0IRM5_9DINO